MIDTRTLDQRIAHATMLLSRYTTEADIVSYRQTVRLGNAMPNHKAYVKAVDKLAAARLRELGITPTMRV